MNHIAAKAESRLNLLSIAGPAFVILTILALVIKESPFYIDLSAVALVGLLLCSRFKMLGLCLATALLNAVLAYDVFFDGTEVTLWELGLGASLELSFIVTALGSAELMQSINEACRNATAHASLEIESWKEKISESVAGKDELVAEVENLMSKLLPLQDQLKHTLEKGEMFERLLEMARNELIQVNSEKEQIEVAAIEEKNKVKQLELLVEDQKGEYKGINALTDKLESELKELQTTHSEAQSLMHKQSLKALDLEWKIEKEKEQFVEELAQHKLNANEAEGKAQALGEQLEGLIDKLKNLQSEKDDLEKALEAALRPVETSDKPIELRKINGLYNQLRSQFDEKSKTLDETRRALFFKEEELLTYQKSRLEEDVQQQEAYERYILNLSDSIEQLETEVNVLRIRASDM